MMNNQIITGLAAGAIAALLYFAVSTGTALSFVLFYVAPLPVILAGLGWGAATGFIAAVSGSLLAAAAVGPVLGLAFLVGCSLPAAWLARLALMSRPADESGGAVEWYPAGRLMIWAAGMGSAVILVAIALQGGAESFRLSVQHGIALLIDDGAGGMFGLPEDVDRDQLAAVLSVMLPPVSAAVWTMTMVFNLWLAARIAIASGRLDRPMPEITAIDYPPAAAMAFGAALVVSFLPGFVGLAGAVIAATLTVAYVIVGLSVIHVITRDMAGRQFLLAALYVTLLVLAWVIPIIAALGLADGFLKLRERARAGAGPV